MPNNYLLVGLLWAVLASHILPVGPVFRREVAPAAALAQPLPTSDPCRVAPPPVTPTPVTPTPVTPTPVTPTPVTPTPPSASSYRAFLPQLQAPRATTAALAAPAPVAPALEALAPPLDGTITTFAQAVAFLYSGPGAAQTGVADGALDPRLVAVIRGRVCAGGVGPLGGVAVSIVGHAEYGRTSTASDGSYSIAVNGGGPLVVQYEKPGYLTAHREARPSWNDYAGVDDVLLVALDRQVTAIDLTRAGPQVARGSLSRGADGARRPTLLVPAGVTAEMLLPDSTVQPLSTLHVRMTEYTVGANGPAQMPAPLPPASGYTYALEFSVDEAIAAGATEVRFSTPLYHYVENFLDFPTGTVVPVGYYDRVKAAWIATDNGRVISIVGVADGLASIDSDGDGRADDGPGLGITAEERRQLGVLYRPGQSLWRAPIPHFTPFDLNWPVGLPDDADRPELPDLQPELPVERPECQGGSIIECQSQTLGERIAVAGTPFSLNYRSDRVQGRALDYTLDIPLSGSRLPESVTGIELRVTVAGQRFARSFAAGPNLRTSFTWDGKDVFGRTVPGRANAVVQVGYTYGLIYRAPAQRARSFAIYGTNTLFRQRGARVDATLWQTWNAAIGNSDARRSGLGGWSLDVHHSYDSATRTLLMGDGTRRSASRPGLSEIISTYAGNGGDICNWPCGDGGPATGAWMLPTEIAVAPAGELLIYDSVNRRIRKVGADGIIRAIAGNGTQSASGDGGPATAAGLGDIRGISVDSVGNIYLLDGFTRLRRIDRQGIITTIAGGGQNCASTDPVACGDGGPALEARFSADALAVAPDGTIYIGDRSSVRQIDRAGTITTIAGKLTQGHDDAPALASEVAFGAVQALAVGPDGSIYVAYRTSSGISRVRRIALDGIVTTVAGGGPACAPTSPCGDGQLATAANIDEPNGLAVGPDGSIFISDRNHNKIRRVDPEGVISTVAGTGRQEGVVANGIPGPEALLVFPQGVALAPDGSLYIVETLRRIVRRLAPAFPGAAIGDILLPSEDGREAYLFSGGLHRRTVNAETGITIYRFGYDGANRLTSVTDNSGEVTRVERDGQGAPLAIVSPDGQRTTLRLGADGYLASVTDALGHAAALTYSPGGLLTSLTDPRGNRTTFTYDTLGRLTRDANPLGLKNLARSGGRRSYSVTLSTGMGRTTTYQVAAGATGERRVTTLPGGDRRETSFAADGSVTYRAPDGSLRTTLPQPDPRFGLLAPVGTMTITTPGGLRMEALTARTVTLANPADPLSVQRSSERITINGTRTYTRGYDAATRRLTTISPLGQRVEQTLDAQGRIVSRQVGPFQPMRFAYDSRGRMVGLSQGDGPAARAMAFAYDPAGRLGVITDTLGLATRLTYDAAGRPLREQRPDGSAVTFAYDPAGNLTALTPPGRPAHTFAYDERNQLARHTAPGGATTTYSYNADGQRTAVGLPGGAQLRYSYDAAGRLSTLAFDRGTLGYSYSPATGQVTGVTAPGGQRHTYTYDGPLLLSEAYAGPVSGEVGFSYNNELRLASTSVNGGGTVTFDYNADGLLTRAGELTVTRNNATGLPTGSTLGVVSQSWAFDPAFGELSSTEARVSGQARYRATYTRDARGRVTRLDELVGATARSWEYGYDALGRLTSVRRDGAPFAAYAYDANGNRTQVTEGGGTRAATYDDQDRLLQLGGASYAYAPAGQRISKTEGGSQTVYSYDTLGALTGVRLPDGRQISYLLDGLGRRVGRQVDGVLSYGLLYEDLLRPIAQLDGDGAVVARFVYAARPNVPEYMVKDGATYRIITDQLGSPRLVVNAATGEVAQELEYDAWGVVTRDTNPGFQPFGFAGGLYDPDTGLVRFGARDYDPATGRWMSKDPIGFAGGDTNLYAYVGNSPINRIDPFGLTGIFVGGQAGAGMGAGAEISGGFYLGTEGLYTVGGGGGGWVAGGHAGFGVTIGYVHDLKNFSGHGTEYGVNTPWCSVALYQSNPDANTWFQGPLAGGSISFGPSAGASGQVFKTYTKVERIPPLVEIFGEIDRAIRQLYGQDTLYRSAW